MHDEINMIVLAKPTLAFTLQASIREVYCEPEIHPQLESYFGGPRLVFHPLPQDNNKQRQPDMLLVNAKLVWGSQVSFEYGLKQTAESFRSLLKV